MSAAVLSLYAGAVAVVVLLLNLGLRTTWSVWVKAAAVVVAFGLLSSSYLAWRSLAGLPGPRLPAGEFELLAADVREPRAGDGRGGGAIFLWVRGPGPDAEPRAVRLAYSRTLHRAVGEAAARLRAGRAQIGAFPSSEGGDPGGSRPEFRDRTPRSLAPKRE